MSFYPSRGSGGRSPPAEHGKCSGVWRFLGIGVSAAIWLRWARDYGRLLERFQKTCMATWYVWHADEIHFRVRGQSRWMFGVMDAETRLIIAHDTAEDKFGYNAAGLFEVAVRTAGKRPDVLVTDGLAGFKTGYKKAMYTKATPRTIHVADVGIRDRHPANNAYERFNGEIRDRIARVRGFKSRNPALFGLLIIYHNFMRPHGRSGRQDSGGSCRDHDIWSGQMAHPDEIRGIVLRITRASDCTSDTCMQVLGNRQRHHGLHTKTITACVGQSGSSQVCHP